MSKTPERFYSQKGEWKVSRETKKANLVLRMKFGNCFRSVEWCAEKYKGSLLAGEIGSVFGFRIA